jgi:N-acetyl-beta-hexosaminidase
MAGKFIIEVTQEVINDSIQRDSSHCMIAEAVKQAIPDAGFVSVDLQTIRFSHKKTRKRYVFLTPRRAQVELIKFDQGIQPEPFSVQLQRGQVIEMSERKPNRDSKAEREAKAAETATQRITDRLFPTPVEETPEPPASKKKRPYKRAEIKGVSTDHDSRAQKVGGQAPPVGALSTAKGRERRFGLKSLAE